MTLRFTNGALPFPERGETGTAGDLGLPAAGACTSRRNFTIRLRAPMGSNLRSARAYVGDRRVAVRRGGVRLLVRVDLRGRPKGTIVVRIVARTTKGRTITCSRRYRTCTARMDEAVAGAATTASGAQGESARWG